MNYEYIVVQLNYQGKINIKKLIKCMPLHLWLQAPRQSGFIKLHPKSLLPGSLSVTGRDLPERSAEEN